MNWTVPSLQYVTHSLQVKNAISLKFMKLIVDQRHMWMTQVPDIWPISHIYSTAWEVVISVFGYTLLDWIWAILNWLLFDWWVHACGPFLSVCINLKYKKHNGNGPSINMTVTPMIELPQKMQNLTNILNL